jgi:uncharacterized protein DUF1298
MRIASEVLWQRTRETAVRRGGRNPRLVMGAMSPRVFALNVSNVRGPSQALTVVGRPVRAVYYPSAPLPAADGDQPPKPFRPLRQAEKTGLVQPSPDPPGAAPRLRPP